MVLQFVTGPATEQIKLHQLYYARSAGRTRALVKDVKQSGKFFNWIKEETKKLLLLYGYIYIYIG